MDVRDQFQNWMEQWAEASKTFKIKKEVLQTESAVAEVPVNANPIQASTLGMDQDVHEPKSLGATYDISDLENLQTLKLKLHDLLSKLNSSMEGKGGAKLETQIVSLQAKIDEFSNYLSNDIQ